MDGQPHAMPQGMTKSLAVPGSSDDIARFCIDLSRPTRP